MEAIARQKYIHTTPRKLRLVAGMIKTLTPKQALEMLPYSQKRASEPLFKAIKAAVANAQNKGAQLDELVFKEIQITDGPRLKRGRPVSRGTWHPVVKRTSHIRVVVEQKIKPQSKKEKKIKDEAKVKKEDK